LQVSQTIAAKTVAQVLAGKNLTLALESALRSYADATPQQRAVAQDLSYGTLRFYGELDAMLTCLLEKPLQDVNVECLLLVAIYQLNHDKAASHTVVDQAVNAASHHKKSWVKGLVNGVLRNFLRQHEALKQKALENEVARYSYPEWWINKVKKQYPADWQAILETGNQHPPMTLRINQRKTNPQAYFDQLVEQEIAFDRLGEYAFKLAKPVSVDKVPGFATGEVSVQDYGAQCAAYLLDAKEGMRVLDACCAPGGKTGHILELAEVQMVAIDSDAQRLQRTESNLDRLGLHATLSTGDAAEPNVWWDGKAFDRILADVPCTASGIVRRHVDIKWLRREADVGSFVKQQALILPALWQLLAKGGKLLYVTCSIFHEENQQQIDRFLKANADAEQLPLERLQSTNSGPINLHHGQLHPCAEHDGFFYALLQKN